MRFGEKYAKANTMIEWEDIKWEVQYYRNKWLKYPFLSFKYGIQNIFKWSKIVWGDRDWDYSHLLDLLEFKLRNMADHHEKYGDFVDKAETVRKMRITAELCKRINEDNYLEKQFDEQDLKADWGANTVTFSAKYMPTHTALLKRSSQIKKDDLELLGKMLSRHLTRWWT